MKKGLSGLLRIFQCIKDRLKLIWKSSLNNKIMKEKFDLVGSMNTRGVVPNGASAPTTDQLFENCLFYPIENPYSGKKTIHVSRRPGVPASGTVDTDYVALTGFYHWKALGTTSRYGYYSPAGNVYRFTPVDSTGTNAVQNASASPIFHVSETYDSSGVTSLIWIAAGSTNTYTTMYMWSDSAAAQATITVPSGSCGHPVHSSGYTFVANTDGKIYNSPLNNPAGSYTDFISTDFEPDVLVTLWQVDKYILALGTHSMEWFEITENTTGSPLRHVDQLAHRIGIFKNISSGGFWSGFAANPPPIVKLDEDTFWIGQSESGLGVYKLNASNRTPQKISTSIQDKYLTNLSIPSIGTSPVNAVKVGSRRLLLIYVTNNWLCYDLESNIWSIWSSTKVNFSTWRNTFNGEGLISAYNTGTTATYYTWEPDDSVPYLDIDANITRTIRVGPIDFDTNNYKRWDGLAVLGDQQTTTSSLSISVSYDDYANFSTAQTVDMANQNTFVKGLGVSRSLVIKLSDTVQREQRLRSMELTYEALDT